MAHRGHEKKAFGRQAVQAHIARHWHASPYAAVVLEGAYEEAGEGGRFRVAGGCVLIHGPFSAHRDHVIRNAAVLNLALPVSIATRTRCVRITDPDRLARTAERDPAAAVEHLAEALADDVAPLADAPDLLAGLLSGAEPGALVDCARGLGVSRQTAFRWFKQTYGVAPSRFRVEARARRAWRAIVAGDAPLSIVAAEEGFADQAHMTRDVRAITGRAPGAWRAWARHSFKSRSA